MESQQSVNIAVAASVACQEAATPRRALPAWKKRPMRPDLPAVKARASSHIQNVSPAAERWRGFLHFRNNHCKRRVVWDRQSTRLCTNSKGTRLWRSILHRSITWLRQDNISRQPPTTIVRLPMSTTRAITTRQRNIFLLPQGTAKLPIATRQKHKGFLVTSSCN